ncbi:hypothetical protein D3C86_1558530 [compost metagenome]
MGPYTITYAGRESGEAFSNYLFYVSQGGRRVAELSHDYRGDAHWIRLPGERWIELAERVLEGGGPKPVVLSPAGVKAVDRLLG